MDDFNLMDLQILSKIYRGRIFPFRTGLHASLGEPSKCLRWWKVRLRTLEASTLASGQNGNVLIQVYAEAAG